MAVFSSRLPEPSRRYLRSRLIRMPTIRFFVAITTCALAVALRAAPAAAEVAHLRSFPVSSPVFTLDDAGDVYVARNGAVDRYDSEGAFEGGFSASPGFESSNDIAFAGGRLYALAISNQGSINRLFSWLPDGTQQLTSAYETSSLINLARGLGVAGGKAYVGTGETNRVVRLDVVTVFGLPELVFGRGVATGQPGGFEVCIPGPDSSCLSGGFSGPELGQPNNPRDIAVDGAGNLYVAEAGTGSGLARIELYNADPAPVAAIGSQGTGAGQLSFPHGVVLDGEGSLFVADTSNHRVMQFRTDGAFVQGFGYGVRTGAATLETCTITCLQGLAGSAPGQLSLPLKIAIDSGGELYVSSNNPLRIEVFSVDAPAGGTATTTLPGGPTTTTSLPGLTTTTIPGTAATTTTTTTPSAVTTTTLPAACARLAGMRRATCLLETALAAPLCDDETAPPKVDARIRGKLGTALKLLRNAEGKTGKALRRLLRRSRRALAGAASNARKAAAAKSPRRHISEACAATIQPLVGAVEAELPPA
jgi:hypothetical protein